MTSLSSDTLAHEAIYWAGYQEPELPQSHDKNICGGNHVVATTMLQPINSPEAGVA